MIACFYFKWISKIAGTLVIITVFCDYDSAGYEIELQVYNHNICFVCFVLHIL